MPSDTPCFVVQVGLVQWRNVVSADNGAGPLAHIVNGKDCGGALEMSWVVDDRARGDVDPTNMAGIQHSLVVARTAEGQRGSAGSWPSAWRRIAGIITHSPVLADPKHSALMSIINVTFQGYEGGQFFALEACGKCKTFQGGATTFVRSARFVQSSQFPALSFWSWGHQGVFLDLDGSLLNNATLPPALRPRAGASWSLGPGASWHSGVENDMFDPAACVYANRTSSPITTNDGVVCSPALTWRRTMLNQHAPEDLAFRDLLLTSLATNRTSVVHFTKYNVSTERGSDLT